MTGPQRPANTGPGDAGSSLEALKTGTDGQQTLSRDTVPIPVIDTPPRELPGHDGMSERTPVPTLAGLPLVQQPELTPDEAARSFQARRRLSLWAGLLVLVVILVAEIIALSPWTDPAAGQPPRQVPGVSLADVDPYGVNTFLHK